MKSNIYYTIASFIALIFVVSCENIEDTYQDFLKGGEKIYIGKADSIKVRSGNQRLELSWLLLSDPKVTSYKVSWNNNRDSIKGDVIKTNQVDTVRIMLNEMTEGIHHFEIIMYDGKGNSSIKSNAIGKVYGQSYQNSLLQRTYRSIRRAGNNVVIEWMDASADMLRVEQRYTDSNGTLIERNVASDVIRDTVPNFPRGTNLQYRTVFLPDPTAIDTFYTEYHTQRVNY